jgi:hypothetical protein
VPGIISLALVAEDELSMAVLERIVASSGRDFVIERRLTSRGIDRIRLSIDKFAQASRHVPHIVLVDLDAAECPVALRSAWGIRELPDSILFRVAVRETEGWLLGDRDGFCRFAAISPAKIPIAPETEGDPKRTLVNLVRRSRSRRLATELVPPQGSAVPVGPLYNERLIPFVREHWDVKAAAACCPSLQGLIARLADFMRES